MYVMFEQKVTNNFKKQLKNKFEVRRLCKWAVSHKTKFKNIYINVFQKENNLCHFK